MRCAAESENTGLLEDSVVLYDLAGDNDRTLKTLCRIISQVNLYLKPLATLGLIIAMSYV